MTPRGQVTTWAAGLTTVLGLAFDRQGRRYALESMTAPGFPGLQEIGTGMVVRVSPSGALETITESPPAPRLRNRRVRNIEERNQMSKFCPPGRGGSSPPGARPRADG